jgi:aminopeptidase N
MKMFRILLVLFFIPLSFAQQIDKVDFIKCDALVLPNASDKSISGTITYEFKVKKAIDTIKIDAKNMEFTQVIINGNLVNFKNSGSTLDLFEGFKKGKNKVTFRYLAKPKQTLYFTGTDDNLQIWTQGQGKYTSHWLPSFDDVNEKVVFNLSVKFQNGYNVISNGVFKNVNHKRNGYENGFSTYNFQMQQPMSSYLVMLAIGNFEKQFTTTQSGTPLEFYLDKNDVSKFEPTYRYSKELFDYLEQEIGVKYPWGIYRQVPVRDFLYAGMENTTSTIFSQDFVVDNIGFNDRNYVNVNAHELAHQWFGNFITAQSGKHHWLQEGFATYYALLAERHLFGDDYFYEELNEYAEQLIRVSKTDTIPVMNEKASSLSFYKKGAWALHVLREDIGVKLFQKAIKKYLKKYQYKNVNTDDFLRIVKEISGYDVKNFKKVWLETAGFDRALAQKYLNKNSFIQDFSTLRKSKKSLSELVAIMQSDAYYPIKQYVVFQTQSLPYEERKILLDAALATNSIPVRQKVAETMQVIPPDFKATYETLLLDDSYITNEIALNHLCDNFPDDCLRYLEQTKGIVGNNDMSFRLSWLALVINSENVSEQIKISSYNQLVAFASDKYESSVRQNALELLLQLNPNDEQVIELLFKATVHHKWQFTKFCRDTIRENLKNTEFRSRVEELSKTTDENTAALYLKFLKE